MKIKGLFAKLIVNIIILSSCSLSKNSTGSMNISFIQSKSINNVAAEKVLLSDLYEFDISLFRTPYNTNSQGSLVGKYSPVKFVATIGEIDVSDSNRSQGLIIDNLVMFGPRDGIEISPTFDLCYAKDVINISHDEIFIKLAKKISLTVFSRNSHPDSSNNFPMLSEVCLDLGSIYEGVTFKNEITAKKEGTLHYFELADLIPLVGNNGTCNFTLIFNEEIQSSMILNPDGSYALFDPDIGNPGLSQWGMAGYVMYLPITLLDLTKDNDIVFSWNLENLIEIYDNNTPSDMSDDLITLRLDNPFPITIYCLDRASESIDQSLDGLSPPDISNLDIRYWKDYYSGSLVYLKWVNPSITDLLNIKIIRKVGSAPLDEHDGEIVYTGKYPIFKDTNIESGNTYYYLVLVEDSEGKKSNGKVIPVTVD